MIITPKYSGTFYFYILFGLMLLFFQFIFLHGLIIEGHEKYFTIFELGALLFFFMYMLIVLGLVIRNLKLKNIDTTEKSISVRLFPFLFIRKFRYSELDGYSTGRLRHILRGDDKLNKFVIVIKDNRVLLLMDERHIKNIPEFENSMKELKYLGYRNLSRLKRWRLIILGIV